MTTHKPIVGITLWKCRACGEIKPKENFENHQHGDSFQLCYPCAEVRDKEFEEWFNSPERAKENEEKRAEKERDLIENYNYYEWVCSKCGTCKTRYIKKDAKNQTPDLWCGCYERTEFDTISY